MRKFWIVVMCMAFSGVGYAQSRYFVNVSGGIDYNMNKFHSDDLRTYRKLEDGRADFNVGLDLGYRLSKSLRVRLELRYVEYSWGKIWNEPFIPWRFPEELAVRTELSLSSFAINPRVDFKFLSIKNWETYLSAGYRMEYATNQNTSSTTANGKVVSRENIIDTNYRKSMAGLLTGVIVKYNINKNLGVFFAPDYTLFSKRLYPKNQTSMQRFNGNLGVSWILN